MQLAKNLAQQRLAVERRASRLSWACVLVDTHCHLTNSRLQTDLAAVLAAMRMNQMSHALTIATGLADAEAALALAAAHPELAVAAGIDPHSAYAGADLAHCVKQLGAWHHDGKLAAIGEFGYEWHHHMGDLAFQSIWVDAQLGLARDLDLPVVLHARSGPNRDAHADMLAALDRHPGVRGVIHSFDGDGRVAAQYVERGFYLAINGMVTFKPNHALRAAVAMIPADRLLVETDSPYLAPVPHRGQRNEPALIIHVVTAVANARAESVAHVAAITTANAHALFRFRQ